MKLTKPWDDLLGSQHVEKKKEVTSEETRDRHSGEKGFGDKREDESCLQVPKGMYMLYKVGETK